MMLTAPESEDSGGMGASQNETPFPSMGFFGDLALLFQTQPC